MLSALYLPAGSAFCVSCGEDVGPATESAEVTGPDAVTTENAAQSEKTVNAGLIIGIAAVVVIAAAVVVIIAKKKK